MSLEANIPDPVSDAITWKWSNSSAGWPMKEIFDAFRENSDWSNKEGGIMDNVIVWIKNWLEKSDSPFLKSLLSLFNYNKDKRDELAQSLTPYTAEYIINNPDKFVDLIWNSDILKEVANISERLQVSPNMITAIWRIESNHNPLADRFEPHVYDRYIRQWKPEEEAKMLATSYWAFQIMWFNYEKAWYSSVENFVSNMNMGNRQTQFDAFANFVENNKALHTAMKGNPDFKTVATLYNWPKHASNNYVPKLKKHFYAETGTLIT